MSRPKYITAGGLVAWVLSGDRPSGGEALDLWRIGELLRMQSVELSRYRHETPLDALRRTIPRQDDGRPSVTGGWEWLDEKTSRIAIHEDDEPEVQALYPGPVIESDDGAHWSLVLACVVDACEKSKRLHVPDGWGTPPEVEK